MSALTPAVPPLHAEVAADALAMPGLRRVHTWLSLTALGVGGIVGAGIFLMAGMAAGVAGPAIMVSFLVAAFASATTALCYAELSSRVPAAGSSYAYGRAAFGKLPGWLFGWNIVLCFAMGGASVAAGWSRYLQSFLAGAGVSLPQAVRSVPVQVGEGGASWSGSLIDLPALAITLLLTTVAVRGIRGSLLLNGIVLAVKLGVLLLFIGAGAFLVEPQNWTPFAPLGWGATFTGDGRPPTGMLAGAAMVFYAYLGFESISAHVEEAQRPDRDCAVGTVLSVAIVTLLYVAVIAVLTGLVPYREINPDAPLSDAFRRAGMPWGATLITLGALAAITNVLLVIILTLARVVMAMGRDGLLPPRSFGAVHPRYRSPFGATLAVGAIAGAFGALVPLRVLADVLTIGMLLNFAGVAVSVLLLRSRSPKSRPAFQAPFGPLIPLAALAVCGTLAASLPLHASAWLFVWAAVGLVVYIINVRTAATGSRGSRASGLNSE